MRPDKPSRAGLGAFVFAGACVVAVLLASVSSAHSQSAQSVTPAPSVSPAASVTPSLSPAPSASPSPIPTPTILMLPPDAAPQILWVQMSPTTPHAGDMVSGVVLTSSNVASVEIRVGGFSVNMSKTDVGHFEGSYTIPRLPFFISHNLTMRIIARNSAGVTAERSLPLQIR
jgi:hypothetical protein